MFKIENDKIYLTRGDSAGFDVSIYNGTTPYTLQEGDILTFTVRQNLYSAKVIYIQDLTTTIFRKIGHSGILSNRGLTNYCIIKRSR